MESIEAVNDINSLFFPVNQLSAYSLKPELIDSGNAGASPDGNRGNDSLTTVSRNWVETAGTVSIQNPSQVRYRLAGRAEQAGQAVLVISCENGTTGLRVDFGTPLGSRPPDGVPLQYKIGDNDVVKANWPGSADGRGVVSNDPVELIKLLLNDRVVFFMVPTDSGNGVIDTYFRLEGLNGALAPIREACGWDR